MPRTAERFIFEDVSRNGATISCSFVIEFPEGDRETYTGSVTFPVLAERWDSLSPKLVSSIMRLFHLALGMSYWKMYCPPKMELGPHVLTKQEAEFWNTIYTKGLGEFFYRNQIDFRNLISFPFSTTAKAEPISFEGSSNVLSAWGGGKDSVVSLKLLETAGFPVTLFSLGSSKVQTSAQQQTSGQDYLVVERMMDPKMLELSRGNTIYNGHVPITFVYQIVGITLAALNGMSWVVFSNERSASYGNVDYLGMEVNHQWSKSLECELLFRDYIKNFITPSVTSFSLLRPFDEIEIVRRFTNYPEYFGKVSSCNRNFSVLKARPDAGDRAYWCGECPKCAFVFSCLAAFLPKEKVVEMVGKNMYADEKLIPLFRELLGIEAFKPFECVGTAEETIVAFNRALQSHAYEGDAVMKMFETDVLPKMTSIAEMEQRVFSRGDLATIPEPFRSLFDDSPTGSTSL